jgi:hypothetical protein
MGKIIAIKGHPTRGNEVLEILEMLGGKNISNIKGNYTYLYYIGDNNFISLTDSYRNDFIIFTLEEFLEKYPFKVGEKVRTIYGTIGNICECRWGIDNCVAYKLNLDEYYYFPSELIPCEEEIKEEDHIEIHTDPAIYDDSKTDITIDGEKLITPNGYTIGNATRNGDSLIVEYVKNKPQYPKTYEECYAILNQNLDEHSVIGYRSTDVYNLQLLLICRDAFWKIAGEELGLSEPWKPNFGENFIYAISAFYGTIQKTMVTGGRGILLFPTEEMRDAFYENFKFLIDKCKEFL